MVKDADPLNCPSMKLAFKFMSGRMSKLAYRLLAVICDKTRRLYSN